MRTEVEAPVEEPRKVSGAGVVLAGVGKAFGDVVVYPEKRTFKPARGVELPY